MKILIVCNRLFTINYYSPDRITRSLLFQVCASVCLQMLTLPKTFDPYQVQISYLVWVEVLQMTSVLTLRWVWPYDPRWPYQGSVFQKAHLAYFSYGKIRFFPMETSLLSFNSVFITWFLLLMLIIETAIVEIDTFSRCSLE